MADEATPEVVEPTPEQAQADLEARIDDQLELPKAEPAPEPEVVEPEAQPEPEPEAEPQVEPEAEPEPKTEDLASGVESIEVEDSKGNKFKISSVDDLPEDFLPKNNRQVIQILRDLDKLEVRTAANAEKAEQEAAATEQRQAQEQQMRSWDSEIGELQKDGRLDKPKVAADAPGFMDDPAVKKVDAVFTLMAEENKKRSEAGNPNRITSFQDALDILELREYRKAQAEDAKSETATAKAKSGLIGRSSTPATSDGPAYVSGSANSIWDL